MQYALLIYRPETALGPEGNTALSELLARHVAFTRDLGPTRIGGAGLKSTASATTARTQCADRPHAGWRKDGPRRPVCRDEGATRRPLSHRCSRPRCRDRHRQER